MVIQCLPLERGVAYTGCKTGAIPARGLTKHTRQMRKTITIALALLVVALCAKNHQQRQIITGLTNQSTITSEQFNNLMDRIEQDHPNYVEDVLVETDAYQSIIENL